MGWIHGIDVKIEVKGAETQTDGFGHSVGVQSTWETVHNVLVAPQSTDDLLSPLGLENKEVVYQLGIPKGDTHDWRDVDVQFFGETFHTVGEVLYGIDALIPLGWNGKVRVEKRE